MVYRKIFTTGLDSRTHTHTHTHTRMCTRFTKAHAQASSRFSVSPFLTHTHTHTHTHRNMAVGDVLVVLVLGDAAIATTQLLHHLLEYRKRDKQTPTVFVSFTSSCITGISFFCFFFKRNTLRLAAHTHTHSVDAVLAEGSFIGTFFACRRQRAGTFSDYLTGAINTHMQLTVLSVSRHVRSASAPV